MTTDLLSLDWFLNSFIMSYIQFVMPLPLFLHVEVSETDLVTFQAKRSSVKLDLYRKFSNALAVTVIVSVAWIAYEVMLLCAN